MHVTMENAHAAIEAARKKAVRLKTKMCIAVVDSGANLKPFVGMDDATIGLLGRLISCLRRRASRQQHGPSPA